MPTLLPEGATDYRFRQQYNRRPCPAFSRVHQPFNWYRRGLELEFRGWDIFRGEGPGPYLHTEGVYTVSLSESNSACQNSTMVRPNYITVGTKPLLFADFTVSPVSGTAPLTVKCTDQSVGTPTRYNYNFGDGVNMAGPNPVHTYKYPGNYTITQSISKYDAATNSVMNSSMVKTNVISVNAVQPLLLVADFTISPTNGTVPLTVQCIDKSMGDPTRINYNFGDGINWQFRTPSIPTSIQVITQ